uniref:Secreted protein n=1 Tax=Achlya hypogyna TaxID=1202772 RepID=A0A0A7CPG1_ACHHY|nr:secreted protein [Achlya hypogyna]
MRALLILALALAAVDAFWMNDLANKVAALLQKLEPPAINKIIDEEVQKQLAANSKIKRPPLVVRRVPDGSQSYRVLQVPDLHYTNWKYFPCMNKPDSMKQLCFEKHMTEMLDKMIDDTKPDFVAFTGDQIESLWVQKTWEQSFNAIDAASAVVNSRGLPWAMVFGNHDESLTPLIFSNRKIMMAYIESLPLSYTKYGPFNIGGAGNFELTVQTPTGSNALRMYFVDTGRDGTITPAQVTHVKRLGASHKNESVPALMFFHIPIPEYKDFKQSSLTQGTKREDISSSKVNSGLFDAMVESTTPLVAQGSKPLRCIVVGDVKATFCGHNHLNDFCFMRGSINLCYGGGVGYGWSRWTISPSKRVAYGKGDHPRTARVIDWSKNATDEAITTWLYLHDQDNSKAAKYTIFQRPA